MPPWSAAGASPEQAARQVWLIDKQGLLSTDLTDLRDYQRPHARDPGEVTGWSSGGGTITLLDTVKHAAPTILLGTSTVHGAFAREVIETMSATVERPIVFPISNPTSRIEAMPADVIAWSGGKALVAVGIPVGPVEYQGVTYQTGQANNALVYPGLGLGTIVAGRAAGAAGEQPARLLGHHGGRGRPGRHRRRRRHGQARPSGAGRSGRHVAAGLRGRSRVKLGVRSHRWWCHWRPASWRRWWAACSF